MPIRIKDPEYKDLFQQENGMYYLRYWSPMLQRTLEFSLKTTSKMEALRNRKRRLDNLANEKTYMGMRYKKMRQLIEAFDREIVWKSPATKKAAMNQIKNHILPFFGEMSPDRVNNEVWTRYVSLKKQGDPDCSFFNTRKYLMKILNWAFSKRYIKIKPVFEDMDREREKVGVVVSRGEFQRVLNELNPDWKDIAELAWEMGFRISEIKKLSWDRVNFKTKEVHFAAKDTKTRRPRSPVMTRLSEGIFRRRFELRKSPWVFPGKNPRAPFSASDEAWQAAKLRVGAKFRFHDLRHTWLTRMFKASNNYATVCAYAGLSLDEALKTYVKFNVKDMESVALTCDTSG